MEGRVGILEGIGERDGDEILELDVWGMPSFARIDTALED